MDIISWSKFESFSFQDLGEKEEGGWRKRAEGDSEWRRPVGDR